jgi:hypothetical protein
MRAISLARVLLAVIVWWYAIDAATVYGGVWDSQANPIEGGEVTFPNDERLVGTLKRDWDRFWVLTIPGGTEVRFVDYVRMSYKMPEQTRSFVSFWRSTLPVLLVSCAVLCLLFLPLIRSRRTQSK